MAGSIYAAVFGTGGTPTAPGPIALTIKANSAAAWALSDGTTSIVSVDTRNTVTAVAAVTITASPPTITSASGTTFSQVLVTAITVTLAGGVTVTALDGVGLYVGGSTITSATATTVSVLSNAYFALPVAGGSVTATTLYSAHFGGAIKVDGGVDMSAGVSTYTIKANTAAALAISDATTSIIAIDSRNTVAAVGVTLKGAPPTITAATGTTWSNVKVAANTVTLTGTTTVTAIHGIGLYLDIPTVTDASAGTVTIASNLYIAAVAAAGGSLTITNSYMISTSVSDCFLTNAGVWTSHSSTEKGKQLIRDALRGDVIGVLNCLRPRAWKYKPEVFGDDLNRQRIGIVTEELPEALDIPGNYPKGGLPDGVVGSFALAALKTLWDEICELREEVARLKSA